MEQAADMRRVIPYAEAALNQPRHPGTSPQVRRQSDCLSALNEHPPQTREVTARQTPRPPRGGLGSHCPRATLASCCLPASNAAPIDADLARHLDRGEALVEQAHRSQPSPFEFLRS